jgi:AcrR family transcriptional regulator
MDQAPGTGKLEIGKQQAKSQRARKTICDATIDCLVKHGYGETSLNRVAAIASFSKGALQHHFPSKEDLMTATADRLLERSFTPLEKKQRPESVEQALLLTWKRMINTGGYRALLEILTAARTDQKLQDRISDNLHRWNRAMDEQSISAYQSKTRDDEDVKVLMTMTRSLMRGLVIQDRYAEDPASNIKMVERWIELVAPLLELRK